MSIRTALVGAFLLWLSAVPAGAQPTEWRDRAFASGNLAFQLTDRPFDELVTPVIYTERASIAATHPVAGQRLTIDAGGGIRVWRSLGVGGGITRFAAEEMSTVVARVPHPTTFNQPRLATKDTPFRRTESAIHLHAVYVVPVTPRLDVMLTAGPSFISVTQDLVQRIDLTEAGPPFAAVGIGNVATLTRQARARAIHAGADVTWFLTPVVGFGVTARYVTGSLTMPLTDGTPLDIDVGGLQVGWGARIRLR